MDRKEMMDEARRRVKSLSFGDIVTNVCAGPSNPIKRGIFVRRSGDWVECTDGTGRFWTIGVEVVFPGHLSDTESDRLFDPIHAALYGRYSKVDT